MSRHLPGLPRELAPTRLAQTFLLPLETTPVSAQSRTLPPAHTLRDRPPGLQISGTASLTPSSPRPRFAHPWQVRKSPGWWEESQLGQEQGRHGQTPLARFAGHPPGPICGWVDNQASQAGQPFCTRRASNRLTVSGRPRLPSLSLLSELCEEARGHTWASTVRP